MKRLFSISIAGLMCLAPLTANAQKIPMASESDRNLQWSYMTPDRTGQTLTGITRFIVNENFNSGYSRIITWCVYLNDTLMPWTKPTGLGVLGTYIFYNAGLRARDDNNQDSVGCWNTTAVETSQQYESYEASDGFDITLDTRLWQNGSNTFKIEAMTALGARFSKSATVTINNIATTTTTTTTTTTPKASSSTQTGVTGVAPTTSARIGTWIDPPTITNLSAVWSDKVAKSQISVLVGNSTLIEIKYGKKGEGTFKTKKIQLAEGINYFPAESRAEFTLSGLSPKTSYNGSLQSSGTNGKSGLVTFSFKSTSIPPKATSSGSSGSSGSSSSSGSSGSSGSSSSSSSIRNVVGWWLDEALYALGLSSSYASEASNCRNKTWFGIVDPSNWKVVGQSGKFLFACKVD